jgi:3-hydroxyisobutyrate dehydrogenase
MQKIAVLGLGVMGAGMAANWLKKGFGVSVYNRTPAKAEVLAAAGARVANSPREAAQDADMVVAMVADDDASRAVWQGADGALAAIKRGAIVVESSTLTPEWIGELAGLAKARGADFLDSPVGGSKGAAVDGKLALFVGGDKAVLDRARPALEAISIKINHLGPIGAGATWKLINNMIAASHLAVLAEALALARKANIDIAQAADLISTGAGASPIVTMKLPRMTAKRFGDPDFALKLMAKDMRYATALAKKLGVNLTMVPTAAVLYERGESKGLGELDFAAIVDVVG